MHDLPAPPRNVLARRRGDGLIRGLVLVAVLAILGGVYVGWRRPMPRYPRVAPSPRSGS